jgi:hypothetical protein
LRHLAHRRLFSHPHLKPFKKDIRRAVGDYLEAVESSANTAQQGIVFATNATYLCGTLADQPLSDVERNRFLEEVRQIGGSAFEDAEQTCKAFDNVQRDLYQVCIQKHYFVTWLIRRIFQIVEKIKQQRKPREAEMSMLSSSFLVEYLPRIVFRQGVRTVARGRCSSGFRWESL